MFISVNHTLWRADRYLLIPLILDGLNTSCLFSIFLHCPALAMGGKGGSW